MNDAQPLGITLRSCGSRMIRQALETYSECKINVLAQNIINSLEYDNSAVFVLEKLGNIIFVRSDRIASDLRLRNAFLDKSPTILDMIVKLTCSNEKAFEKVYRLHI